MKKSLFSLVTGLLPTFSENSSNTRFQSLSQNDFVEFAKQLDTVVIDLRSPSEYRQGHVPEAINLPHRDIVSGRVTLDELNDKNLVFYCHTGARVAIVNKYLNVNPIFPLEKLFHLEGDFRAWQARGLTIAKP